MKVLLDTSFLIDLTKGKEFIESKYEYFINSIVYAETLYGFIYNKGPRTLLDKYLKKNRITILNIDQDVAELFVINKIALKKKGETIGDFDLLIAATAIANRMPVLTKNIKHFSRIPKLEIV